MAIPTGRFVWFEYASNEPKKAQSFFSEVLGWGTRPMEGAPDYALITAGKETIGGYSTGRVQRPHWVSYLQVESARDTAAKIKQLGGKVVHDAVDMPGIGTHVLVADPLGAEFALWQPAEVKDTGDYKEAPGTFCWNELYSEDPTRSVAFYQAIGGFSDKRQEMPGMGAYHVLESDGKQRAGVFKMPGMPAMWLPYVHVTNADATHDKARRLGADIKVPPQDIPNVGRFSIFNDPLGATIAILQPRS